MKRFADKRHRQMTFVTGILGSVLPIVVLGQHHSHNEAHFSVLVAIGTTFAIFAPLAISLIPTRHQTAIRFFSYGGIIGLTAMQAYTGGAGSIYAILLVMPMVWFGLLGTRRELAVAAALVLACCFLPARVFPNQFANDLGPAVALAMVCLSVMLSLAVASNEVQNLTARLADAARYDQLTALLNRRGWEEACRDAIAGTLLTPWCTVLIDLDKFKTINDTIGHEGGDRVLKETGARLRAHLSDATAIARLGGDEFAALFVGSNSDEVYSCLQDLQYLTPALGAFSAGIAAANPGDDLRSVMRRADLALYEVKSSQRGGVRIASLELPELIPGDL